MYQRRPGRASTTKHVNVNLGHDDNKHVYLVYDVKNVNVTSTTRAKKPIERDDSAMVTKMLFGDLLPVKSYIYMKPPSLEGPK